jgi:hypothetical protein
MHPASSRQNVPRPPYLPGTPIARMVLLLPKTWREGFRLVERLHNSVAQIGMDLGSLAKVPLRGRKGSTPSRVRNGDGKPGSEPSPRGCPLASRGECVARRPRAALSRSGSGPDRYPSCVIFPCLWTNRAIPNGKPSLQFGILRHRLAFQNGPWAEGKAPGPSDYRREDNPFD